MYYPNIKSIRGGPEEFRDIHLLMYKYDIISLSESWLNDEIENSELDKTITIFMDQIDLYSPVIEKVEEFYSLLK